MLGVTVSFRSGNLLFPLTYLKKSTPNNEIKQAMEVIKDLGVQKIVKDLKEFTKAKRLFLTIKRDPFEQILAGYKMEEYRDINTHYMKMFERNNYDNILLQNGYTIQVPRMLLEVLGIEKKYANPDWCGGESPFLYAIKLGKVLEVKNLTANQIKEIKAKYRTEVAV
jgi:hypothetical protein